MTEKESGDCTALSSTQALRGTVPVFTRAQARHCLSTVFFSATASANAALNGVPNAAVLAAVIAKPAATFIADEFAAELAGPDAPLTNPRAIAGIGTNICVGGKAVARASNSAQPGTQRSPQRRTTDRNPTMVCVSVNRFN